jgi:hypothetical protein
LTTDARLNHHPQPPTTLDDSATSYGRHLDSGEGQLHLRFERRVVQGLPDARAFAFTIRTSLTPITALNADERKFLDDAVEAMPQDASRYKCLSQDAVAINCWPRSL